MAQRSWYNRPAIDSTCKNKWKKKNNIFSFEAPFSKIISLKIGRLTVHYMQEPSDWFYHSSEDTFSI